jgi:hypothetical protein
MASSSSFCGSHLSGIQDVSLGATTNLTGHQTMSQLALL